MHARPQGLRVRRVQLNVSLRQYLIRWRNQPEPEDWTWEDAAPYDQDPHYVHLRTDYQKRLSSGFPIDDSSYQYDWSLRRVRRHEVDDLRIPAKIMGERIHPRHRVRQFLILWRGETLRDATWEETEQYEHDDAFRLLRLDYNERCKAGVDIRNPCLYYDEESNTIVDEGQEMGEASASPSPPTAGTHSPQQQQGASVFESAVRRAMVTAGAISSTVPSSSAAASALAAGAASSATHGTRFYGGRHWLRRLHLLRLLEKGLGHVIRWGLYAPRTLLRMRQFLMFDVDIRDINRQQRERLIKLLHTQFYARPTPPAAVERKLVRVFKLEWTSTQPRHANLRSVLLKHRHRLPLDTGWLVPDELVVAKRLIRPFGKFALYYTRVARTMDAGDLISVLITENDDDYQSNPQQPCIFCSHLPDTYRPQSGCVVTGDLSLITLLPTLVHDVTDRGAAELLKLCELGPRFRCASRADPMRTLYEALTAFIHEIARKADLEPSQFNEYKHYVLNECRENLDTGYVKEKDPVHAPRQGVAFTRAARSALRAIHERFALAPIDKAANQMAIICRAHYLRGLRSELHRVGGAYQSAPDSDDATAVILRHSNELSPLGLMDPIHVVARELDAGDRTAPSLPYLYWLPKLHKSPVGARFIAGSASCTTTKLSKVLTKALSLISQTLRTKDDELLAATGIRRYIVIDGFEQFTGVFRKWHRGLTPHPYRKLASGDFSTLYTTLPHDDLVDKIRLVIQEAWDWLEEKKHATLQLKVFTPEHSDNVHASWATRAVATTRASEHLVHSKHEHPFTRETLTDAVRLLVDNIYSVNGGKLLRQVVGIPMGTNCAPLLANLYLYWYESTFIDQLSRNDAVEAQAFHMTFRYIDDVLSADNPYWTYYSTRPCDEGGIYPRELTLSDTTLDEGNLVHYVGTSITNPPLPSRPFHIDVFNKRSEFPFVVRLYPHMSSLIPTNIPYGVFTGQLHRFAEICSTPLAFINQAISTASVLLQRGCVLKRLCRCFKASLQRRYAKPQPPETEHKARYTHYNPAAAAKESKGRMRFVQIEQITLSAALLSARGADHARHEQPSPSITVAPFPSPPIVAASPPLPSAPSHHHHHHPHPLQPPTSHHDRDSPHLLKCTNGSGDSTSSTDRCARGA